MAVNYVEVSGLYLSDMILSSGDFFDPKQGGDISGEVNILSNNLYVLSGNFIQTNTPQTVKNYSPKNVFVQSEGLEGYGDSFVGTKAYCIIKVLSAENQFKLKGDISILGQIVNGELKYSDFHPSASKSRSMKIPVGLTNRTTTGVPEDTFLSNAVFSVTLGESTANLYYHISDVDVENGIVTMQESISNLSSYSLCSEEELEKLWDSDDNAFYLAGFPEVGNIICENFFCQHVEGGSNRAIGKFTHIEGRDGLADGRYSHVEGSHCVAGEMASHAEGFRTYSNGRYSHAEGTQTTSKGRASHAEGYLSQSEGKYSHAEGNDSLAFGDYSHSEGNQTSAIGDFSHATGNHALANGKGSFATGYWTKSDGSYCTSMGVNATANENYSFAWNGIPGSGNNTNNYVSKGQGSFCINPNGGASNFWIGDNNLQDMIDSHQTTAYTQLSVKTSILLGGTRKGSVGNPSLIVGGDAAATGGSCGAIGWQCSAVANNSFANGQACKAGGASSHAEGFHSETKNQRSHADGYYTTVKHDYAYAWNGDSSLQTYTSQAVGSYSINPANGIDGFYIGTNKLTALVPTRNELSNSYNSAKGMYEGFIANTCLALSEAGAIQKNGKKYKTTQAFDAAFQAAVAGNQNASQFFIGCGALISALAVAGSEE